MGSNKISMEYFSKMNLDDKLATLKYTPDSVSHLKPNNADCKTCKSRPCENVCPAGVYEWLEDEQKLLVKYENCLECGACRIVCEKQSLNWEYPKGTKGVMFKKG